MIAAMTRGEILISAALLVAFVAGMRWGFGAINEAWGLGGLGIALALEAALILPIAYVVERRRGNLPRWLQPKAKRPPSRG